MKHKIKKETICDVIDRLILLSDLAGALEDELSNGEHDRALSLAYLLNEELNERTNQLFNFSLKLNSLLRGSESDLYDYIEREVEPGDEEEDSEEDESGDK